MKFGKIVGTCILRISVEFPDRGIYDGYSVVASPDRQDDERAYFVLGRLREWQERSEDPDDISKMDVISLSTSWRGVLETVDELLRSYDSESSQD